MVGSQPYAPARSDLVWLEFSPQTGHEQAGRRPAVCISPFSYNKKVGLALFCPITSAIKGYPFEVILPPELPISGAILSDQVKSMDWRERKIEYIASLSDQTFNQILAKIHSLI